MNNRLLYAPRISTFCLVCSFAMRWEFLLNSNFCLVAALVKRIADYYLLQWLLLFKTDIDNVLKTSAVEYCGRRPAAVMCRRTQSLYVEKYKNPKIPKI